MAKEIKSLIEGEDYKVFRSDGDDIYHWYIYLMRDSGGIACYVPGDATGASPGFHSVGSLKAKLRTLIKPNDNNRWNYGYKYSRLPAVIINGMNPDIFQILYSNLVEGTAGVAGNTV